LFPLYSNSAFPYLGFMTTTIQIGSRGTMTLPKPLRKALGVDRGGVVMATVEENGIVLHPAVAFPIELYSDARVAEFDEADAQLAKKLARKHA
jgi:bifunctional DNA-binding transcriptional regulator/antitoxin component of YhaV-PrlF toxin-antitoxin module